MEDLESELNSSQWPFSHWWGTAINGIRCCGTRLGGGWAAGVLYYLGAAPTTPLPTHRDPEAGLEPRAQLVAISKSQGGDHQSLQPPYMVAWQGNGLHALIHASGSNAIIPAMDPQGHSAACTQGAREAPSQLLAVSWPWASPFFSPLFPSQAFVSHPQHAGPAGPGPSRLGVCTERPCPGLAGLAGQHSPARPSLLGAGEPVPLGGHGPSLLSNYSIAGLRLCLIVCVL